MAANENIEKIRESWHKFDLSLFQVLRTGLGDEIKPGYGVDLSSRFLHA